METNSNQISTQPLRKKTVFRNLALILSLSSIPSFIIYLISMNLSNYLPFTHLAKRIFGDMYWYPVMSDIAFIFVLLGILAPIIGIILGIISLIRREQRKGIAIAAILTGLLTGLAMCFLLLLLAMAK